MSSKKKLLIVASIIIFLLAGVFYPVPGLLISAGEKAMSSRNWQAASIYFTVAQWLNPWRKNLYEKRAEVEYLRGNFKQALAFYEKTAPPKTVAAARDYYYRLGSIHFALGNYEKAIEAYTKASQSGVKTARELNSLSASYWELGDINSAKIFAEQAISKATQENDLRTKAKAYNNLGLVYKRQGYNEAAEKAFKEAILLWPDNPIPYYNLGELYENWGKTSEAIRAYEKALALAENFFIPRLPRLKDEIAEALRRVKSQ